MFPVAIVVSNLLAALVFAIVKDVLNNSLWGTDYLVLDRLAVDAQPARAETPHLEISGRRAGLVGYVLTLLDVNHKISLTAHAREVRKSSTSLLGKSREWLPLWEGVSVEAQSRRSPFWLLAAMISLTAGAGSGLLIGRTTAESVFNAIAWLLASGIYLLAYYQSHRFEIKVHGSLRTGVSFKPGLLDGRAIRFDDVQRAAELLVERIQASRSFGPAAMPVPHTPAPAGGKRHAPLPAFSPAGDSEEAFPDADETLNEPFPAQALAAGPSKHPNTGTVEYGEDQPAFEAPYWSGPEPGTSDSIQLRQSITRSETGMFLGVPANFNEYDEEVLEERDTDSNIGSHRGTVAWEDHADKTQDEMRAEAELADLRSSRPKRGEAKQRLRELMRRFPMTEAADKARRMLERLESGG